VSLDKEVLIGSFSALSGPVSTIGIPFYHGFQAYINYVNDNGGVNGRKIKVNIADDQLNPALTVPAVKKFVEEDKGIRSGCRSWNSWMPCCNGLS